MTGQKGGMISIQLQKQEYNMQKSLDCFNIVILQKLRTIGKYTKYCYFLQLKINCR